MNHPIDEQASAFVDDELDPRELPMFTAQVARNPELRRKLARYAVIGDCLRGDLRLDVAAMTMADRVRDALAAEPMDAGVGEQPVRAASGWWRPGLGIAAGLAIAAALLLQLPTAPTPSLEPVAVTAAPAALVPAAVASRAAPARADVRMTNYLVYHGEYAGMLSSRAVASRIVDQDSGTRWVRQAVLADD